MDFGIRSFSTSHSDDPCFRCKAPAAMVVLRTMYVLYHRCTLCGALWSTRRASQAPLAAEAAQRFTSA